MTHVHLPEAEAYRALLCLNGELPPVAFFEVWPHPIVAADGAANQLMAMGVRPDCVIGDLDSLLPCHRDHVTLHEMPSQESTDADKALDYLRDKGWWPVLVVGVAGGYVDHMLTNLELVMRHDCAFYAPPLFCWSLHTPGVYRYAWPYDTKISLLGMPRATMTTQGLAWDLTQATLAMGARQSTSNRAMEPTVSLELHEGSVLLCRYLVPMVDKGSLAQGWMASNCALRTSP